MIARFATISIFFDNPLIRSPSKMQLPRARSTATQLYAVEGFREEKSVKS
jgi:hypothetical protein